MNMNFSFAVFVVAALCFCFGIDKFAEARKMKIAAGFVIFRRVANDIEYLLLQTSYGQHHWTPPKGILH